MLLQTAPTDSGTVGLLATWIPIALAILNAANAVWPWPDQATSPRKYFFRTLLAKATLLNYGAKGFSMFGKAVPPAPPAGGAK